jgi:hypothetical protein
MNKRLFTEEVIFGGEFTVNLTVLAGGPPRPSKKNAGNAAPTGAMPPADETANCWQALKMALADLCEGRLALGADGHGYFKLADGQSVPEVTEVGGEASDQSA